MTAHEPTGWEPDPQNMGNWQSLFDSKRQAGMSSNPSIPPCGETPHEGQEGDDALSLDPTVYRPWILQRGRTRPAMMLEMRRFEPRSGLWTGWAMSYPSLYAVEYIGDRMLSLDFGTRQFLIEGNGFAELIRGLQTGSVLLIQEYSSKLWEFAKNDLVIKSIKVLTTESIVNSTRP